MSATDGQGEHRHWAAVAADRLRGKGGLLAAALIAVVATYVYADATPWVLVAMPLALLYVAFMLPGRSSAVNATETGAGNETGALQGLSGEQLAAAVAEQEGRVNTKPPFLGGFGLCSPGQAGRIDRPPWPEAPLPAHRHDL